MSKRDMDMEYAPTTGHEAAVKRLSVPIHVRLKQILDSHPNNSEGAIEGYVRLLEEVRSVIGDVE